jgi:peptide deformylase
MIIINNEEALRVPCEDVLPEEVGGLLATLEAELNYANKLGKGAIGLAAPQIGIAKKIAIVRMGSSYNFNFNFDLVNCSIEQGYDPSLFRQEGCLSFPGRVEDTIRFQEVHITNNLVYPHSFVATGLLAVVCQHEIDHYSSTLFIDRLAPKVASTPPKRTKAGPNDPCLCGSKKKYKKCCGKG